MRTLDGELANPKYAHIERERRWLVKPDQAPDLSDLPFELIEDCYIDDTRMRLRRMTDSASGSASLKLTKKYANNTPTAQPMVTSYLSDAEYSLLDTLAGNRLRKRRYPLKHDGLEWGLDLFENPVLEFHILEVEADVTRLEDVTPPPWIDREVTGIDRYSCARIAAIGKRAS